MPMRKTRRGKRGRRRAPLAGRRRPNITVVRGNSIQTISVTSTPTFIALGNLSNASSFPAQRLYNIASNFTLFRFTSLTLEFLDNTLSTSCAISYQPAAQMNVPNTFTNMCEGEVVAVSLIGATVPSYLKLGRSVLLSEQATKWFSTNDGSTTPSFQGNLFFAGGGSAAITFKMSYICEFTGAVPHGFTQQQQTSLSELKQVEFKSSSHNTLVGSQSSARDHDHIYLESETPSAQSPSEFLEVKQAITDRKAPPVRTPVLQQWPPPKK